MTTINHAVTSFLFGSAMGTGVTTVAFVASGVGGPLPSVLSVATVLLSVAAVVSGEAEEP